MSLTHPDFDPQTDENTEAIEDINNQLENIETVATISFANTDVRFFSELGLPDAQGWTLVTTGDGTITLVDDVVFGVEKQSIEFKATSDSVFAQKPLTGGDWDNALEFGVSYSAIARFKLGQGNGLFSGMGFSPANDPRPSSIRGRVGVYINSSGAYTTIQLDGKNPVTLDGTNGRPAVLVNEWFAFETVVNPSDDAGVNFGDAELYVNDVLVQTGDVVSAGNNAVDNRIKIVQSSSSGDTIFYVDNFGVTIYEEGAVKLLTSENMSAKSINIIRPGGWRSYEITLPDNNPRNIGDDISIIASKSMGTVILKTENLLIPQTLFNGVNSITLDIAKTKALTFVNSVDNANVYQSPNVDRGILEAQQTGMIEYNGMSLTIGFCSDTQYSDQSTCELNGTCSDTQYTDQTNCELNGKIWTLHTWTALPAFSVNFSARIMRFVDKVGNLEVIISRPAVNFTFTDGVTAPDDLGVVHFYEDISGNIFGSAKTDWTTPSQSRQFVYLGNADVNLAKDKFIQANNPLVSAYGLLDSVTDARNIEGSVKGKGGKVSANGLGLDISGYTAVAYGRNFGNKELPHTPTSSDITLAKLHLGYKTSDISMFFGPEVTALDPANYQRIEDTTLSLVPDGRYTIQRVYQYPGTTYNMVVYGSTEYYNLDQAIANASIERYNLHPSIVPACFLAYVVVRNDVTNLETAIADGHAAILNYDGSNHPQTIGASASTIMPFVDAINIVIEKDGDLEKHAIAGVITVDRGMTFTFKNTITTAVRFNVVEGATLTIRGYGMYPLFWTGTGTFITSVLAPMHIQDITMIATNNGTLLDLSGDIDTHVVFNFCVCIGWNMGNVYNVPTSAIAPQFYIEYSAFFDWTGGLTCTNTTDVGITDCTMLQLGGVSANVPFISMNGNIPVGLYASGTTGSIESGESFLFIDPQVSNQSRIHISGQSLSGTYFATNGTQGQFTAVADASIGATAITSVLDNSGIARFNYTGDVVYVNQEVVISGFTTNDNYNGTFTITTTATGWFEVPLAFSGDETGSFLSNSITLTDTGTTLVEGDTLTISSENILDYDGGGIVYNKQINSFQVSKPFSISQAGTWNTSGLDQSDRRVIASNNPSQASSKYIGAGYMNGNTVSNIAGAKPITNNTYTDIVLGGSGLIKSSNIERWKIVDPILGILEYVGNEPFSGFIDYNLSSVSVGGAIEFRYKWVVNRGSGYQDLPDLKYAKNVISTITLSTSDKIPLSIVQGDKVKPQITRTSGSSNHTTTDFSVSITPS